MNGLKTKTTKQLFRNLLSIILIGSLAVFSSCEKGEEPTPPVLEPAKYIIKGQVLNQQTNQPLQGVTVKMGSLTTTSGATGEFEFKDLADAGKYTLTFTKEDFFNATYSLEFQQAEPNQVVTFSITVTMVPYVEGVTPITPGEGGTINIGGDIPVVMTIPAGVTVTDANNQPVTGPINITAVQVPDIVTPTDFNPGLIVIQFGPAGLQFSEPLPVKVENPFNGVSFDEMQLEYYNESTNVWEVQPQSVTYDANDNTYKTTINHFSTYKISINTGLVSLSALEEAINVIDSPIENNELTNKQVESIKVQRKSGYIFVTPVETILANAGVPSGQISELKQVIESRISQYYGNTGAAASLELINDDITVNRTLAPNHRFVTTGLQLIDRRIFDINIRLSGGTPELKTLQIEVHSAGAVTLYIKDEVIFDHGGGTN